MSRARPKRAHSFSGCKTCRRRHLKCDQSTPACNRCRTAGLTCEGFAPALRWLTHNEHLHDERGKSEEGTEFSRRHLFTDESLRSLSKELASDVPSTVTAALNEVDEKSKGFHTDDPASVEYSVGPFRAFRFGSEPRQSVEPDVTEVAASETASFSGVEFNTPSERHDRDPHHGREPPRLHEPANIDLGMTAAFDESTNFLDFLQWGDLFTCDTSMLDVPPLFPDLPPNQPDTLPIDQNWQPSSSLDQENILNPIIETPASDAEWPQLDLAVDAPLLLRHFNDEVINQMGSLPINEKSAWRTLHFPSAIMTLSYLTVLGVEKEKIKHANLANFYALIAVSALHLSLRPGASEGEMAWPGDHYRGLSLRLYAAAKHHLRLSLEKECQPPLKAKYKEQLLGISATLAFALLSGIESDTRWCLTEMEYLITLRGLTKPSISRRARLLHNIYAWMRIVSESTHVLGDAQTAEASYIRPAPNHPTSAALDRSRNRSQAGPSTQPIKPHVTLDNFLHLQPKALHQAQVNEASERDIRAIHLAESQPDKNNMYMQIYGVPETWLSLVSQITRLANVMDRLSTERKSDAELLMSLHPRSSDLENAVCTFRFRHQVDSDAENGSASGSLHTHMVHALSSALVIFFYRRIRNVNPLVLQDSVDRVIESLHVFDAALEENGIPGPGTAWPAFIAGAEALRATQRRAIGRWLDRGFEKSGFAGYRVSKEVLVEVWRRMDEGSGGSGGFVNWMEVCRQMRKWPLLS